MNLDSKTKIKKKMQEKEYKSLNRKIIKMQEEIEYIHLNIEIIIKHIRKFFKNYSIFTNTNKSTHEIYHKLFYNELILFKNIITGASTDTYKDAYFFSKDNEVIFNTNKYSSIVNLSSELLKFQAKEIETKKFKEEVQNGGMYKQKYFKYKQKYLLLKNQILKNNNNI